MIHPDDRVDPNGRTFKKLVSSAIRPSAKAAITFSFSLKGKNLLKSIEQLATVPYDDQTGKSITAWVVGIMLPKNWTIND